MIFFGYFSSKSRVRGHLRLYLAFIQEDDNAQAQSAANTDPQPEVEQLDDLTAYNEVRLHLEYRSLMTSRKQAQFNKVVCFQPDWELVDMDNSQGATGGDDVDAAGASGDTEARVPRLMEGWQEKQDSQGRMYYVNNEERISQYEFPTPSVNYC